MLPEEILKTIGEMMAGAAVIGVPMTIKWLKEKSEKIHFTTKKIDIAQLVSDKLTDMRAEYHIDRIGLLEFSNGDRSVQGFPFLFVTMTYEKCKMNVASIKHMVNKTPASWYVEFNSYFTKKECRYACFFDDGRCWIDGGAEFKNEETGRILNGFGIKSQYTFKINDNIGMGLINVAFIDEYKKLSDSEINDILGDCHYISVLFNQRPH